MTIIVTADNETLQFSNEIEKETVQINVKPEFNPEYDVKIDENDFDIPEIPGAGDLGKTGDGVLDGNTGSGVGGFNPNPGSLDVDTGHSAPSGPKLPGELDPTSTNGQTGVLGPNGMGSLAGIKEMPGATKGNEPVIGGEEFPGGLGTPKGDDQGLEGIFDNPVSGMENGPVENPVTSGDSASSFGDSQEFLPKFGGEMGDFGSGTEFDNGGNWDDNAGGVTGTDIDDSQPTDTGGNVRPIDPSTMTYSGSFEDPNNNGGEWVSNDDRFLFGGWEGKEESGWTWTYFTSAGAADANNDGTDVMIPTSASAVDSNGNKHTVSMTTTPGDLEDMVPVSFSLDLATKVIEENYIKPDPNMANKPSAKMTDGEYHGGTASVEDILNGMGKDKDPLIQTFEDDTIDTSNLGNPSETVDSLNDLISLKDPEATSFGSMEPSLEYVKEVEDQLIQTVGTSHETVNEDGYI